ncbi:uncharacterized protein GGS25DRAFT_478619 [Hypoxylon fragiforme]|uniref:uncharacterized protein n=1 Tax=Hypoxylon fragiforme TaxID=63214 RepID=UPI0020C5E424|nr:uncharacterized protein GGS25DRAFT_478619 [Hypoxylon fragiforme]KAI2613123.1 hypothetical protein GGS25DRAFT_478619 [Hypoxylon fragiforme]
MPRELTTPTVLTILFLALTGIYGFLRFSHENVLAIRRFEAVVKAQEPVYLAPSTFEADGLEEPHRFVGPVSDDHQRSTTAGSVARPLITYAYSESPHARENLKLFIDNGLHSAADFIFILAGPTSSATSLIPSQPNIQIIQQPNNCLVGFGAHRGVLRKGGLWKKYSYFIAVDASVRAPFAPYPGPSFRWSDVFLSRLGGDVKLVGLAPPHQPHFQPHPHPHPHSPKPHLPSTIWATDSTGMKLLLYPDDSPGPRHYHTYKACHKDASQFLHDEIMTTSVIKEAGYKVDVLTLVIMVGDGGMRLY